MVYFGQGIMSKKDDKKGAISKDKDGRHQNKTRGMKMDQTRISTEEIWICKLCNRDIKDEADKALECEVCSEHFCILCVNINEKQYDALSSMPALHWYCGECDPKITRCVNVEKIIADRFMELEDKLEQRFLNLEKEVNDKVNFGDIDMVLSKLSGVEEMMDKREQVIYKNTGKVVEQLEQKMEQMFTTRSGQEGNNGGLKVEIDEINKKLDDKIDNLAIQLGNMSSLEHRVIESNKREMENCLKHLNEKYALTDQGLQNCQGEGAVSTPTHTAEHNLPNLIRQELAERNDIESRKMSLIITGMREPEVTENTEDLEITQKDEECFKNMIHRELSINITEIKVVRIGRKTGDKPRMMKITLKSPKERKDILAKAKMLREATNEATRNVYIRPDLTIKQRDEAKNLRSQLKELREGNPGKRYVIKFNQIKEI